MTSKRKGWDSLSPAYQKRLQRNGITEAAYSQGLSIRGARGHREAPEHAKYRKLAAQARVDIKNTVPEFDTLSKAEQENLARVWVVGITSPAKGPRDPKTGRRKPSAAQVRARMDALDLLGELMEDATGATFWKKFRTEYAQSFSAAA